MIILYFLLIAYIAAINFYAFLLVKTLSKQEREWEVYRQGEPLTSQEHLQNAARTSLQNQKPQKFIGKLCIAGALGGALTIYISMFIFKFRRNDLLLMVLMPLLSVLNIYIWILVFKSGFGFLILR